MPSPRLSTSPLNVLLITALFSIGCGATGQTIEPTVAEKQVVLPRISTHRYGSTESYERKIRADLLLGEGRMNEALKELKLALSTDSDDFLIRTEYALLLIETGKLDEASTYLADTQLKEPTAGAAWVAIAELHMKLDQPIKAEAAAMRGMRVNAQDFEAALWLAQLYEKKNDNSRAQEMYRRVITICPKLRQAQLGLGRSAEAMGNLAESLRHLTAYLEFGGKDFLALVKTAEEHLSKGDIGYGLNLLNAVLIQDSKNDSLRAKLIKAQLKNKLLLKAEINILAVPDLISEDVDKIKRQIKWLMAIGRNYLARDLIISVAGAMPEAAQLRLLLAKVELKLLRYENAITLLRAPKEGWNSKQIKIANSLRHKITLQNINP